MRGAHAGGQPWVTLSSPSNTKVYLVQMKGASPQSARRRCPLPRSNGIACSDALAFSQRTEARCRQSPVRFGKRFTSEAFNLYGGLRLHCSRGTMSQPHQWE